MGQMRVRRTGPWVKISCPFSWVQFKFHSGSKLGYEAAHQRRTTRNKAQYSLDCDDGIEYSACLHEPTPQELLDRMELFVHLWNALNSLPEVQGVRVEAHLILGKSYRQIAREQGVDKSVVRRSVKRGMAAMKKYLKKVL